VFFESFALSSVVLSLFLFCQFIINLSMFFYFVLIFSFISLPQIVSLTHLCLILALFLTWEDDGVGRGEGVGWPW
jgi:hypothetical protein